MRTSMRYRGALADAGRTGSLLPQKIRGALRQQRTLRVTASAKTDETKTKRSARETALKYYELYNSRRLDQVVELIADDCEYQDLIYQDPFRGKAEIRAYFEKIGAIIPDDVRFVVEDITGGADDDRRVGVRW